MRLEDHDRRLTNAIDQAMDRAARQAGPRWGCAAGRTDCCFGPFPINRLDARRLQRGLDELAGRDPARAGAVVDRARRDVEALRPGFPGDADAGLLADGRTVAELEAEERRQQSFLEGHAARPCPALDPATGRCELYAHRPFTCRTYGPPLSIGEERLPACPHCFAPCSDARTEELRVAPDPEGLEDAILDRLARDEGADDDARETLVAFALLGLPPMPRSDPR